MRLFLAVLLLLAGCADPPPPPRAIKVEASEGGVTILSPTKAKAIRLATSHCAQYVNHNRLVSQKAQGDQAVYVFTCHPIEHKSTSFFYSLKPGDTKDDVRERVGPPNYVHRDGATELWLYTNPRGGIYHKITFRGGFFMSTKQTSAAEERQYLEAQAPDGNGKKERLLLFWEKVEASK